MLPDNLYEDLNVLQPAQPDLDWRSVGLSRHPHREEAQPPSAQVSRQIGCPAQPLRPVVPAAQQPHQHPRAAPHRHLRRPVLRRGQPADAEDHLTQVETVGQLSNLEQRLRLLRREQGQRHFEFNDWPHFGLLTAAVLRIRRNDGEIRLFERIEPGEDQHASAEPRG